MLKSFSMLVLLIAAAPAIASPDASSAAGAKAKDFDPKRKICEPVEETGSRLSSKRICMTAEQWEAQRGGKRASKRAGKSPGEGGGK